MTPRQKARAEVIGAVIAALIILGAACAEFLLIYHVKGP